MPKLFWVLLWICIRTWLHLFQTWPLLASRVWTKNEQQNSQQNMWLPEPGMENLAQASSHTKFHQPYNIRLISQQQHFNLSALTRRRMLRKFNMTTKDKKVKHFKPFLSLQVSNTSWEEHPSTTSAQHTGLRGWGTTGSTGSSSLKHYFIPRFQNDNRLYSNWIVCNEPI